jgi:hypothetical protein
MAAMAAFALSLLLSLLLLYHHCYPPIACTAIHLDIHASDKDNELYYSNAYSASERAALRWALSENVACNLL